MTGLNGKRGDAPFTDIVDYGELVFHPKVDQLIRDLSEAGAFVDPFARDFIDNAASIWRRFEAFAASAGEPSEKDIRFYRQNWLHNFAFTLWLRLMELRGEGLNIEGNSLPADRDPTLP